MYNLQVIFHDVNAAKRVGNNFFDSLDVSLERFDYVVNKTEELMKEKLSFEYTPYEVIRLLSDKGEKIAIWSNKKERRFHKVS